MIDFKCRTIEVRGMKYTVQTLLDGEIRISTTCDSKLHADEFVSIMKKVAKEDYTFNLIPAPYVEEVCIECGKDSFK